MGQNSGGSANPKGPGFLNPSEEDIARGKRNWKRLGIGCAALFLVPMGCMAAWQAIDPDGYAAFKAEQEARDAAEAAEARNAEMAATQTFVETIKGELAGCEQASAALGDLMQGEMDFANRVELVKLSEQVSFVCGEESSDIRQLELPDVSDEALATNISEAREFCGDAMTWRRIAAKSVGEVANEGAQPKLIADVEANVATMNRKTFDCAGALEEVSAKIEAE